MPIIDLNLGLDRHTASNDLSRRDFVHGAQYTFGPRRWTR